MKIRYVIDIDIDYDYENLDELQFKLKDELEEYVKDSELGYYADKTSVKLQDNYCINEEKKRLKKQIPKKPNIPWDSITKCPQCPVCHNSLWKNQRYCEVCGQSLDWSDHPTEKGGGE